MALFGRRKPLHRALAERGGLDVSFDDGRVPGPPAAPPGWDGEQRGEPGIHGIARVRKWDAVVTAEAPDLRGEAVHLVALPDRLILAEDGVSVESVQALVAAVEERLPRPFRAEAVPRGSATWAVGASRIRVVEVPGLHGDEAELVATRDGRTLRIDRRPSFASSPALEREGEIAGSEFVVRARRLVDDLWEVEADPL